jgi:nitroreductase
MANVVKPELSIPDDQKLLFGLSFGYPDDTAPANAAITHRADYQQVVTLHA